MAIAKTVAITIKGKIIDTAGVWYQEQSTKAINQLGIGYCPVGREEGRYQPHKTSKDNGK